MSGLILLMGGFLCILTACSPSTSSSTASDLNFGLPGKADQTCARTSVLCWSESEVALAQTLMEAETAYLTQEGTWDQIKTALLPLEYKLTEQEKKALQEVDPNWDQAYTLTFAIHSIYGRLLGGYLGAHSTLVSTLSDQAQTWTNPTLESTKSDASSDSFPNSIRVKPQFEEAFRSIWNTGPMGQYMVFMLYVTGATHTLPTPSRLSTRQIAQGRSLDDEANKIIQKYTVYSTLESTFTNLQALIPVVGAAIAIPYGMYAQFKQRIRMTFEICILYGLDLNQPDDLLIAIHLFTAAQGYKDLFASSLQALVGIQSYSILANRSPELLSDTFSSTRIQELRGLMLAQFSIVGVKLMPILLSQSARKAGRSVLGQITFGVAALVDIGIDLWTTQSMGRELKWMMHPWGWGLFLEQNRAFNQPDYRRCALLALGSVMSSDHQIDQAEIDFFISSLSRPFQFRSGIVPEGIFALNQTSLDPTYSNVNQEDQWGIWIDQDEQRVMIEDAVYASYEEIISCLNQTWARTSQFEQLSLIAWLQVMAHSDRNLTEVEQDDIDFLSQALEVYDLYSFETNRLLERIDYYADLNTSLGDQVWTWGRLDEPDQAYLNSLEWKEWIKEIWENAPLNR
jgi:hypothetical protein